MEPGAGGLQRVVLPEAGFPDAYEAGAAQIREMTRHSGLRGPESRDEIADAHLAVVLQQVQNPQARAIGESTEHAVYGCSGHNVIVDLKMATTRMKLEPSGYGPLAWE